MKSLQLIILSFIILSITCFGQSTHWKYKPQSIVDDFFTKAVEDSSGNVFIADCSRFMETGTKSKLYKLNKNGTTQKITDFLLQEDSMLYVSNLFVLPNQNIMVIGVCGINSTALNKLWVSVYNNQLQRQYTKFYTSNSFGNYVQSQKIIKTSKNSYVGYITYTSYNFQISNVNFFEIDSIGNLIQQNIDANPNTRTILSDIIENPITHDYKCFGTHSSSTDAILTYNTQLQFISFTDNYISAGNVVSVKHINPFYYIHACTTNNDLLRFTWPDYKIGISKIRSKKDSVILYKYIETGLTTNYDMRTQYGAVDFVDSTKIYITGHAGSSFFGYLDNAFKNHLVCVQMDSQLNIKWQKFIGGNANYMAWNSLATKDGGLLLMGSYIDSSMVNQRDAYMIKIGPNGEVLNTNELPKGTQVLSYLVGPNPVQNILNIQGFTPNTTIHIVNSLGKVVMQQPITQQQTELNLSHLSAGVYFYRFSSLSGFILQSGKLVKE